MYKGKTYTVTFDYKPTQKEVITALDDIMNADKSEHGTRTFKAMAEDYIKIKSNVLSPTTIRGYDSLIRNIPSNLSSMRISDITTSDIQSAINAYALNHSPKSTANLNGFISAILSTYRPNFSYKATLPQKIPSQDYIPTDDEIKRILTMAKNTIYEIPLWLCVSGMRRSEVCAVTKKDLSDDNMLTINKAYVCDKDNNWIVKKYPKNESSNRQIKLLPYVADLIRKSDIKPTERLYQGYPNKIYYALHRYCTDLNIKQFRLHTCRAYYISLCHANGIPDQYIMANTGHKTDTTLKAVYRRTKSDTQKQMDDKILNKMNGFLSDNS